MKYLVAALLTLSIAALSPAQPALVPIARNLPKPVFLTGAPGTTNLFIVEQGGTIMLFRPGRTGGGSVSPTPFLNISDRVSVGAERGLLGLAFHPGYATNGRLIVHYTDVNGNTVVSEYKRSARNPNTADRTERIILQQQQPFPNHNGGMITFGPDGFLYIGLGDGGSGGDPFNNGQNLGTLLGKILRIDVDSTQPYAIPATNPFVSTPGARAEIFAYGLRNPWRFSFDRGGVHQIWCGDVGQDTREEVDQIQSGGNYGWSIMEGTMCFKPLGGPCDTTGKILPIYEYTHAVGCSITGGYVYRGTAVPALAGKYLFGDFCAGTIWSLSESQSTFTVAQVFQPPFQLSSFGQDNNGELYVCAYAGPGATLGAVYRIIDGSTQLPDLTGEIGTVTQVCPGGARPCTLQTSVTVISVGPTVRNCSVQVYLSADTVLDPSVDRLLTTYRPGTLAAGADAKTRNLSLRLPSGLDARGQFLIVLIDSQNVVNESNEFNNEIISTPID